MTTLLGDIYLIDNYSKLDRWKNLIKTIFSYFWSIGIVIKLILLFIAAPLITILTLYSIDESKSSGILIFAICCIIWLLFATTGGYLSVSPDIIDSYAEKMSLEFSPNIYGYKYNFLDNIIKSLKDVYETFAEITIILGMLVIMLIGNIHNIIFEDGTLFSFMESLVPLIIFIIYCYRYMEYDIDWITPSQMPKSIMYADFYNNTYMNRNYPYQCTTLIESTIIPKPPSTILWILASLIISFIFGICHLYWLHGSFDNIIKETSEAQETWNNAKNTLEAIITIFNNDLGKHKSKFLNIIIAICNPIQILLIWIMYSNDFNNLLDASIYILKNWDLCASVVRLNFESNNLKYIKSVNNLSLNINKYIYFEIPDELLKTPKDLLFERKFNTLMNFGNIRYAKYLAKKYDDPEIRKFCLNAFKDSNNLLLKDVNISFSKNCNSFVVGQENDKDITISLLSQKGRIVSLKAQSGKGKSTINNCLNGDTRFLSSFVDGHCSSLIQDKCKYLNPYYSQQHETFLDSFSVLDNLLIADLSASFKEIKYIFDHTGISKYYNKLNNLFGLTRFSSGQKDRMKMCRIFALMNNIIKTSIVNNPRIYKEIIDYLTSDDNKNTQFIRDNLNLNSFFVALDEPLGALDQNSAISVMNLLNKYKELGFTILITDHSGIAELYADDIIEIKDKTCKYHTRVNEAFVDCSQLPFDDTNTLIIGDTIAYKDIGNRIKYDPSQIMSNLQDGSFKGHEAYKVPDKLFQKLEDILVQVNSHKNEMNLIDINDNKSDADTDASGEYNDIQNEETFIFE